MKRARLDGSTAFTPVSVGKTTQSVSNAAATAAGGAANSQGKRIWPPELKHFVSRCFEAAGGASDKPLLEKMMRDLITQHMHNNTLWSHDWSKQPLIQAPAPSKDSNRKTTTSISTVERTIVAPPRVRPAVPLSIKSKSKSATQSHAGNGSSTAVRAKGEESAANIRTGVNRLHPEFEKLSVIDATAKIQAEAVVKTRVQEQPFGGGAHNLRQNALDAHGTPIVGKSQSLEKRYLRLTSEPDPATVRPLSVLKQSLELMKKKWKQEANYAYICDQLKSIRQDLTVQRIRNDFAITVYEMHARIALEKGDLGEYNQCQTQLIQLYKDNRASGHQIEFLAYRILYCVHTQNRNMINSILIAMQKEEAAAEPVQHALEVRKAIDEKNYHRLLGALYASAPNMGGYLMDCFVGRVRTYALCAISKAYRPRVSLKWLESELGFDTLDECRDFIEAIPETTIVSDDGKFFLLCKESMAAFERERNSGRKIDIKGQI